MMPEPIPEIEIANVHRLDASKDGQTVWLVSRNTNGEEFALKLAYGMLGHLTTMIGQVARTAYQNQVGVTPDDSAIGASLGTVRRAQKAQVATSPEVKGLLFQFLSEDKIPSSYEVSYSEAKKFLGSLQATLRSTSGRSPPPGPKLH